MKNRLEAFFSSDRGQRVFNFAYSFGAAIVIMGALFKLLHLPMADLMLCVGMGVEALIFALSAFDKPAKNYEWESVFPQLDKNAPNVTPVQMPTPTPVTASPAAVIPVASTTMPAANFQSADMQVASEQYVAQINEMTLHFERLKSITASLANASDQLLQSYGSVSDSSAKMGQFSTDYAQQMEALNRNVTGLNTIYEIQLKSVSAQLDTIDKVNSGLANIRTMYDNSAMDSFKIRQETDRMTDNLAQLNKVYERMLAAMTNSMQQPLR